MDVLTNSNLNHIANNKYKRNKSCNIKYKKKFVYLLYSPK